MTAEHGIYAASRVLRHSNVATTAAHSTDLKTRPSVEIGSWLTPANVIAMPFTIASRAKSSMAQSHRCLLPYPENKSPWQAFWCEAMRYTHGAALFALGAKSKTEMSTHPQGAPTPRRPTPLPHKCLRLTFLRILGNLGNQALCLA